MPAISDRRDKVESGDSTQAIVRGGLKRNQQLLEEISSESSNFLLFLMFSPMARSASSNMICVRW
eukprot:3744664-Pyramimonas_sp.AAC.2